MAMLDQYSALCTYFVDMTGMLDYWEPFSWEFRDVARVEFEGPWFHRRFYRILRRELMYRVGARW